MPVGRIIIIVTHKTPRTRMVFQRTAQHGRNTPQTCRHGMLRHAHIYTRSRWHCTNNGRERVQSPTQNNVTNVLLHAARRLPPMPVRRRGMRLREEKGE